MQTWGLHEARAFAWNQLRTEAEVPEVGRRTTMRAMKKRRYQNCIAYASEPLKAERRDLAWGKRNTWILDEGKMV